MIVDFFISNPAFLLFLMLNTLNACVIFLIIRKLSRSKPANDGNKGSDDDGGIHEPILDLPPGIVLPGNVPKPDLVPEPQD